MPTHRAADRTTRHATVLPPTAPPVLALGTFERVGSNWLSDTLRSVMPQHNEPFRQQLGTDHPLSPLNPAPADAGAELGALGRHHLACAVADLHGQPRHLVKETNLFFTAHAVLQLLPDSPVLVLTRAPVGIASSFTRGRLWERWRYGERYDQLVQVTALPRWKEWAALLPQDDPEAPTALGRMIAVNALLLAQALAETGRTHAHLSYERHVTAPADVLAGLARFLGIAGPCDTPAGPDAAADAPAAADATFATNRPRSALVAELHPRAAALVRHHAAATLARSGQVVDPQVTSTAAHWLSGDDQYEVREPAARPRTPRTPPTERRMPPVGYRAVTRVSWRNLLVSNAEMAELLNALHAAGAPNTRDGTNLLVCPMPHERGGRLHFDAGRRRWRVSAGYESHPAYWVTWAGAAAVAAWSGARLPTRAEALDAAADAPAPFNCGYAVGDTSPVAEPGRGPGQVHHLVGNVQTWCGDGPTHTEDEPAQRYLFGAAWNTPGTPEAIGAVRSRYLLGSSRGVGVRLVRDPSTTAADELGAWEVAERINRWVDALGGPARPVGELDRHLITALAGPGAAGS
ncbi:hypothetical protein GCM10009760_19800 [Kitasatospora kazusensis]|uniref:Sulfatase-modifying factor enzyme domain-containing protein n=1 Tax=Kitasatospora kazusensis TaxID=407974 RepID=A0ABP5KWS5_9ACTN